MAEVPRIKCPEHGVVTVGVPWYEPGSGFTALFEALVIDWLKEASLAAVSRQLGLSWNAIDRIMQRAVQRGLERRTEVQLAHIGVDETSFRKRHDYVTVVSDQAGQTVLHVADDRGQNSLTGFYETQYQDDAKGVQAAGPVALHHPGRAVDAEITSRFTIKPDTAICDACGREYEFTNRKDRCPYCCPKPEPEPDAYELDDWGSADYPESE